MAEGLVSTVARNPLFSCLSGVVTLPSGFILAVDAGNNCIWKVDIADGTVYPFAGVPGRRGYQDGPADSALFSSPRGIAVHGSRVLVADYFNRRIREVCEGVVSTVAGNGLREEPDEDCLQPSFISPFGIAVTSDQKMWTSDYYGHRVHLLDVGGRVETVAGRPVWKGKQDGPCNQAKFSYPCQIAIGPEGSPYVADQFNGCIRRIKSGQVQTILDGIGSPCGIAVDYNNNVYVSDLFNSKIYKSKIGGEKEVLCGTRKCESVDGQGQMASIFHPRHLHYDSMSGCLYFTEHDAIRKVNVHQRTFSDPQLSLDLAKLINSSDALPTGQAVFVVEEKQIKVHCKSVLCIRSEYFNRLFLSQAGSSSSSVPISIEDASYEAFHALITFLMSGVIDVEKCRHIAQDILLLADRFLVTNLRKFLMEYLVSLETVLKYLNWSDQHGFPVLTDACLNFAAKNIHLVRIDAEFESLSKELNVELFKRAKCE